jgi:ketosteroid isomerase-like protein
VSQENVEMACRVFAAFARTGDIEVLLEFAAEDIVWAATRSDFPDKDIYHCLEGVREWIRGIQDAFEGLVWEFEEITDLGQDRVLVVTRAKGHGQFSKIEIDYRFPYVLTFRDGLVTRVDRYRDRAETLEAVWLAE